MLSNRAPAAVCDTFGSKTDEAAVNFASKAELAKDIHGIRTEAIRRA